MAIPVKVKYIGSSLQVCIFKNVSKNLDFKNGDILLLEEVYIEANALSNSFTMRIADNDSIKPNAIILKKTKLELM